MEFHSLMQESQSVEQLDLHLQKMAHKAFPSFSGDDFDRLLKDRFYSSLLPKWQKKLGAPRPSEKFNDLYERARTIERHDSFKSLQLVGQRKRRGSLNRPVSWPRALNLQQLLGRQGVVPQLVENPLVVLTIVVCLPGGHV